jgi:LAGLIDADG DNA endonuclease family protein
VTGADQGNARRPHLTISSKLRGVGGFAEPPDQNSEYRAGYLCGMVRGDGHLKSYVFNGRGRAEHVHWFRLALADIEALHRARDFLALIQVPTRERVFSVATASRREMRAISTSTFSRVERVRDVIRWPQDPSDSWRTGFLAGIFDAEGSCGGSVIRISNTDPKIIDWVTSCLTHFGFDLVVETTRRRNGLAVVRVRGGLVERLRFFHMTAPAITRKQRLDGHGIKTTVDLTVVSIEPLKARRLYAITTRTGDFIANGVVSHTSGTRRALTGSPGAEPAVHR